MDYLEYRLERGSSGLPTPPVTPTSHEYLQLHQALVRRFSSALSRNSTGRNGVQALIGVCVDLGIGVVSVDAGTENVVNFWTGVVTRRGQDPVAQGRALGRGGWDRTPDAHQPCQVYINSAYENLPDGVLYDIPDDPALIGVHDSALNRDSNLRKHPYKEGGSGSASAEKGRSTCSCALHVDRVSGHLIVWHCRDRW